MTAKYAMTCSCCGKLFSFIILKHGIRLFVTEMEVVMEQLNITAAKDNEKIYKILGDLMNGDKEFQIMITVPSGKNVGLKNAVQEPKKSGFGAGCYQYDT